MPNKVSCSAKEARFNGFYGGAACGYAQLFGKRTEHAYDEFGRPLRALPFISLSNKNRMRDQNIQASFFAGYLYHSPKSHFLYGIEPFISYVRLKASRKVLLVVDPAEQPVLQVSSLESKASGGGTLRVGYLFSKSCLLYGLTGMAITHFKYSNFDADNLAVIARKTANAFIIGAGIEKDYKPFRLGLEIRYNHYPTIKFSARDNAQPKAGTIIKARMRPRIFQASLRFIVPLIESEGI